MLRHPTPTASILVSVLLAHCPCISATAEETADTKSGSGAQVAGIASVLPDGLYLVLRSSDTVVKLLPVGKTERLLSDNFHFLEPAEREPIRYLVLQTTPFVPLILASDPKEDREDSGKPRLQLQLAEDQAGPLEDFSRSNLGGTVAIVIGGEIVTTHRIKSAITGGRLQITRCTEHGCETLFTKLLKKGG